MTTSYETIACLSLAQTAGPSLLIPKRIVAEISRDIVPREIKTTESIWHTRVRWREEDISVACLERNGLQREEMTHVVIIHPLLPGNDCEFLGLVSVQMPRIVSVPVAALQETKLHAPWVTVDIEYQGTIYRVPNLLHFQNALRAERD